MEINKQGQAIFGVFKEVESSQASIKKTNDELDSNVVYEF